MEPSAVTPISLEPLVCSYCHQPVLATYYFCPNCGTKLNIAPLSTSVGTQAWIYVFSIVLPMLCFLFVTRWPGWKYYKSSDPKTKAIGINAIVLIALSTLVTIWLGYIWTLDAIKASVNSINADMGGLSY